MKNSGRCRPFMTLATRLPGPTYVYAPGDFIERVSPTPLLMIVADHDHIAVTDLALQAYERAFEPKRLVMIKGGHFDPYLDEFETVSGAAIHWLKAHL